MRYFLDTEFDGFGGDLISLALVREDGSSISLVVGASGPKTPWVSENVIPILFADRVSAKCQLIDLPYQIQDFLAGDAAPFIIADWPDDIAYFCKAIITGPGTMINVPRITFNVARVDAYPTTLIGAIQHNAWWDAMALRQMLIEDAP